jgi:hypothetical protein
MGYQFNHAPSSSQVPGVFYGANSYFPNPSNPPGASNGGSHLTYAVEPIAVPQPAITIPLGGVQKFFHNPEQVTDSALLENGIKSYRKFGGPVASNYQLDPGMAPFSKRTSMECLC